MISFSDDGGREPQVLGIIEDRYRLSYKEWRLLPASSLVMVYGTLGHILVEMIMISVGMRVGVSDPLGHSCGWCSLIWHFYRGVQVSINWHAAVH